MVVYTFQCCSLISSHPLLPPLGPKCLSLFCPATTIVSTVFIDSIHNEMDEPRAYYISEVSRKEKDRPVFLIANSLYLPACPNGL